MYFSSTDRFGISDPSGGAYPAGQAFKVFSDWSSSLRLRFNLGYGFSAEPFGRDSEDDQLRRRPPAGLRELHILGQEYVDHLLQYVGGSLL